MKYITKVLLGLLIGFLLFNCSDDDSPALVSKWKLTQVYEGFVDENGVFRDVNSTKIIEFFDNNTFVVNGSLCNFNISSTNITSGTISEATNRLIPDGCDNQFILDSGGFPYEINEQEELIISFFCVEGCVEKYMKIE